MLNEMPSELKSPMRLLYDAQRGDEAARDKIVAHVFEKYRGRVARTYKSRRDPALSLEDMEQVFQEGIFNSIEAVDHRGDPIYHLGQRGVWAVLSALRKADAENEGVVRKWQRPGQEDEPALEPVCPRRAFTDAVHERVDAQEAIRVVVDAPLRSTTRRCLEILLSGRIGDPTEPGANRRMAEELGVSPQRASQIFKNLRDEFELAGAGR